MNKAECVIKSLSMIINKAEAHDLITIACNDYIIRVLKDARELLKDKKPQEIEIEGGGHTWWHVCPECHGAIDRDDRFCKHCGQAIKNGKE